MNPGACILDAFGHGISVCMILFVVIKVIAEKVEIRLPFLGAGYHKFASVDPHSVIYSQPDRPLQH